MAVIQQILTVLTTLMSIVLLVTQIKASKDFMSKAFSGFKEWLERWGFTQAKCAPT